MEPLTKDAATDQVVNVAEDVLKQCLHRELPPAEPLVRANENFTLAHNLIGKRNYPLAVLALNGAANMLELYANDKPLKDHPPMVQSMTRQISLMIDQIKQRAA